MRERCSLSARKHLCARPRKILRAFPQYGSCLRPPSRNRLDESLGRDEAPFFSFCANLSSHCIVLQVRDLAVLP